MKYQANCPLQLVMVVLLAVFVHLDNGFIQRRLDQSK
jgi:hypothetical protein